MVVLNDPSLLRGISGPIKIVAGGLVWKQSVSGFQIALVYRPARGGDWSLPKGKREENETWEEAALREVKEETGCNAKILSFAGTNHYIRKDRIKIALYWNMEAVGEELFHPSKEVQNMEWLPTKKALERLTYPCDRDFIIRAINQNRVENL